MRKSASESDMKQENKVKRDKSPGFGQNLSASEALARNSHNGAFIGMKGDFSGLLNQSAQPKLSCKKKPQSKNEEPPIVVEKSRSKYLKSLGMVPKGQEQQLKYVRTHVEALQNVTGSQLDQ